MKRPGGGKFKGSEFERSVGRTLSMWISDGQRKNLFSRNVLSGGGYTVTQAKGRETPNIPGDLMAASPLAFNFLSIFSIECKHHADIDLDVFLRDRRGTSFLMKTILHTSKQAAEHGLTWLVIAKENRHEPIVLMDYQVVGIEAIASATFPDAFHYHVLHNQQYLMTTLNNMMRLVSARRFIRNVSRRHHPVEVINETVNTRGTRPSRTLHGRSRTLHAE